MCHQNGQHTAAGLQGKPAVPLNIGFTAEIFPVIAADPIHNGMIQLDLQRWLIL